MKHRVTALATLISSVLISGCTPYHELFLLNHSGYTITIHSHEEAWDILNLTGGRVFHNSTIERRGILYSYEAIPSPKREYFQRQFSEEVAPLLLDESMALYVCDPVTAKKLQPQPEGFPLRPISKITNKDFASAP